MRDYLLCSIEPRYRVWLLQEAPVTWELPYLAGHSAVDTLDASAMLRAVAGIGARANGVLCWDEVRVEAATELAARLGLPGDPAAVRRCRDKAATRAALSTSRVPQPSSVAVSNAAQAATAAASIGFPVVLKPRALTGSHGVSLVCRADDVARAFAYAAARSIDGVPPFTDGAVLVEEYLSGPEISIDCVLHNGVTTPVTLARKQLGYPPYFEAVGHVVDASDPLLTDPAVRSVLHAAHQAVGLHEGWAHTELRLTSSGPKVVEINARLGDHLIPYLGMLATGVDPGLLAAGAACGQRPVLAPTRRRAAGVTFRYPARRTRVGGFQVNSELMPDGVDRVEFLVEPGTWVQPPPEGHLRGRYCYATAVGDTVAQCQDRLEAIGKAITLVEDS
jgi:biotin carboxylase